MSDRLWQKHPEPPRELASVLVWPLERNQNAMLSHGARMEYASLFYVQFRILSIPLPSRLGHRVHSRAPWGPRPNAGLAEARLGALLQQARHKAHLSIPSCPVSLGAHNLRQYVPDETAEAGVRKDKLQLICKDWRKVQWLKPLLQVNVHVSLWAAKCPSHKSQKNRNDGWFAPASPPSQQSSASRPW